MPEGHMTRGRCGGGKPPLESRQAAPFLRLPGGDSTAASPECEGLWSLLVLVEERVVGYFLAPSKSDLGTNNWVAWHSRMSSASLAFLQEPPKHPWMSFGFCEHEFTTACFSNFC